MERQRRRGLDAPRDPYLIIAPLALFAVGLLAFLRAPASSEPHLGERQRSMGRITMQPGLLVAVLSGAVGYAVMILVMTATRFSMRAQGFT